MKRSCLFIAIFCLLLPNTQFLAAKDNSLDLSTINYPRLANIFLKTPITDDEAEQLAKWDVLVFGMQAQSNSAEQIRYIREQNPDVIILAYVASQEFPVARLDEIESADGPWHKLYSGIQDDWWLYKSNGEKFSSWPGNYSLNVHSGWNTYLANFMHDEVISTDLWDGIFYDNVWENVSWVGDGDMDMNRDGVKDSASSLDENWYEGMTTLLKTTRDLVGENKIIIGNGSNGYMKYMNGRMMENFPDLWPGLWDENFERYYDFQENGYVPTLTIVNGDTNNTGDYKDYQDVRYAIASTLLDNGFFSYDWGTGDHSQLWWYDEYNVALGSPKTSAYNTLNTEHPLRIEEGLWRRDFENGLVLVNSTNEDRAITLGTGYEKIIGTQDTEVNNGKITAKVTIPAKDGLILLGRLAEISNASYTNGSYAKVYNWRGRVKRNSFFSYDSHYQGGYKIIKITDKNKTIVASETYVEIYKNGSRIARFAPFGENFKGGINIAIGKLYKKDKRNYLVVGSRSSGSQIRIYSLKGQLKNPGCFPYGEGFKGGVSVAVGDLSGSKDAEIVVSPGTGGGPQVLIFNNKCEKVSPGFMAYGSSLRTGINVAVGDVNKDGKNEIVTGTNLGGKPLVRIFNKNGKLKRDFYAGSKSSTNGVLVAVSDVEDDGVGEIITSSFDIYSY
ncbi:MAG: putative glycoside hydrolase [Patescibacteria group bacterium]